MGTDLLNHLDNYCVCSSSRLSDPNPLISGGSSHLHPQEMGPHWLHRRLWDLSCPILRDRAHRVTEGWPTPFGMAGKAPSGWLWQHLGLREHLNHCCWDRLSALLNNTQITKQAYDYFQGFLISRWSLICQILVHYSAGLFCQREMFVGGGEKEIENAKENLTRLLPLFENPKYMCACMSC